MRYLAIATIVLAVMAPGCKRKQPAPQTIAVEPPMRPIESLKPVTPPPAPPRPKATVTAVAPKPATASARTVKVVKPAPAPKLRTHTIKKGDTLWSLAKNYLGDGRRWPEIVKANPGLKPERLQIGQTLNIPDK